jgi:hypothetical protein
MKSQFKAQRVRDQFNKYLKNCTDKQVVAIFRKEQKAGRKLEMDLAMQEIERRDINLREYR